MWWNWQQPQERSSEQEELQSADVQMQSAPIPYQPVWGCSEKVILIISHSTEICVKSGSHQRKEGRLVFHSP